MARVIYGGVDAFDAVVYGEQDYSNQLFFKSQVESATTALSNFGNQFFASTAELYNRYYGSDAVRLAKAAVRGIGGLFLPNKIQQLNTIGNLQQAPLVMQQWIMTNPMIRNLYHKQQVDGYQDTYIDSFPGQVGIEHAPWREVMSGVVQEDAEGNSHYSFYMDDKDDSDRPLGHEDKADILNTWDILEAFLEAGGDDPSSPYNTKL